MVERRATRLFEEIRPAEHLAELARGSRDRWIDRSQQ
jgi:hypothetical protein